MRLNKGRCEKGVFNSTVPNAKFSVNQKMLSQVQSVFET